jgi:hypothetical protein
MKAATAAVRTYACVSCSACLSRGLRPRRSAVAPQATDWLLAPGSTRSLRPAARAAWERSARAHCVSCWCTSRAVSTGGVSASTETATLRATTAAVHTHAWVTCSACLFRCLRQKEQQQHVVIVVADQVRRTQAKGPSQGPVAYQPGGGLGAGR